MTRLGLITLGLALLGLAAVGCRVPPTAQSNKIQFDLATLDANGLVTVSLDDPAQYDRITAVIANTSVAHGVYSSGSRDWTWTGDTAVSTLRATSTEPGEPPAAALPSFTPCPPTTPTPTPTPTPTASPTARSPWSPSCTTRSWTVGPAPR